MKENLFFETLYLHATNSLSWEKFYFNRAKCLYDHLGTEAKKGIEILEIECNFNLPGLYGNILQNQGGLRESIICTVCNHTRIDESGRYIFPASNLDIMFHISLLKIEKQLGIQR